MLTNPEVRKLAEAERREAMVKHTAEMKERAKAALPELIFIGVSYVFFAGVLFHDARKYAGTERGEGDWFVFIWGTVIYFGVILARRRRHF